MDVPLPRRRFRAEGERTGRYKLAGEEFTANAKGESFISYADYAAAMLDVIESGKYADERISCTRSKIPARGESAAASERARRGARLRRPPLFVKFFKIFGPRRWRAEARAATIKG